MSGMRSMGCRYHHHHHRMPRRIANKEHHTVLPSSSSDRATIHRRTGMRTGWMATGRMKSGILYKSYCISTSYFDTLQRFFFIVFFL